jgi:hypothetical protein
MTDDVKAAQPSGAEKTTTTGALPSNPPEDHRPLDDEHEKLMENEHVQNIVESLTSGPDPEPEEIPVKEPEAKVDNPPTEKEPEKSTDKPESKEKVAPPPAKEASKSDLDTSYPDEKELKSYTGNSQRRIRQLVAARKSVEEKAAKHEEEVSHLKDRAKYRDDMEARIAEHKIDPKAWDQWTSLGFLVQQKPSEAAKVLAAMAKNLGVDPGTLTEQAKTDTTELDEDLAGMVASFDMTDTAAEKIQASRRRSPAATRTEDPPVKPAPSLSVDPIAVGNAGITKVDAEYRKKYPDQWDSLVDDVMTEMAQYKGSPPHLWEKLARDCAEKVVKRKVSGAIPPDPSLRPRGGRRAQDEDLTSREGMAEAIASGKYFSS